MAGIVATIRTGIVVARTAHRIFRGFRKRRRKRVAERRLKRYQERQQNG